MARILLVEDDPLIARGLEKLLAQEGFTTNHGDTLAAGRRLYRSETFDLILLDVNLPDGTGFELCREIRAEDGLLPIIFLTARTDEETAVKGLSAGACDFVRKPFPRQELVLRIRKAIKQGPRQINLGGLSLDSTKRRATWNKSSIDLTDSEFEILAVLAERIGYVVSQETLVERLRPDGELMESSIKSHVSRLKSKLNKAGVEGVKIEAVYGQGYRMEKA